ncbi:MAG: SecF protein [Candidatus Woesebacteria bacterium GW2011_GWE1_45_18]|uniref:Protein-export membrane protein SecF n=8 Tax=Candidatus Woeseibacteriota TaxID=1752722 RepID=A0A0G1TPG0_9BACT|nr:MAG: SecF protein [Candidatus Woesebacteria bacterium GW2011_GWE1_45_18]KKU47270.1 MAG: SecF protein [Candidatus Woesebacteria bacterium GW2011_GWF2_46_8]OGM79470.1 MAG: protein-export membrane protein SecF [Candidatus Woesebacteria bacterium RIFOXYA1_FULL_48_16]OGM88950.1 MAG: protein-export membrane protein SecF [Candidatus Woesebacteria bacterium RIFOXYD1_FULL_46_19]
MNWMKYRLLYLAISAVAIGAGIFGLLTWGLRIGIDFKGGTILEYRFEEPVKEEDLKRFVGALDLELSSLEKTGENAYTMRISNLEPERKGIVEPFLERNLENNLEELRYESVGPSIGPDLIKKTLYAMGISAVLILLWVAIQFRSFKFGVSAVLAMFHDSMILVGSFALLGHFFGAEIDFLFVTAVLTILSFSVHDTIVVYDRIRETRKKVGGSMTEMANMAVSQTMVRSLNNSFTIIFMLAALLLLGGETIKWFAAALLIGTIAGTYSSPFVAVPILVTWDELQKKIKRS